MIQMTNHRLSLCVASNLRGILRATIAIAVLLFAGSVFCGDKKTVEFNNLIDSLASKNKLRPKVVEVTNRGKSITFPVFPDNFDFAEQTRVRDQLEKLTHTDRSELWSNLLSHFSDERYSLTVIDEDDETYSMMVGDWCRELAERDLYAAYFPHVPPIRDLERRGQIYAAWKRYPEPSILSPEWREQNANKPLWELQIEFCEWAITEAPGLKQVSEDNRIKFVEKIRAEIERLKATHAPVINQRKLTDEARAAVTEKIAKRLSEKHEKLKAKSAK